MYFSLNIISFTEDSSVLGCDALHVGVYYLTFREIQTNFGKHYSNDTSSHRKRFEPRILELSNVRISAFMRGKKLLKKFYLEIEVIQE